jgi:small subunit ribosomal protein S20
MAHSRQARKRIRQNEKAAAHNRPLRTRASRTVRDARIAIANGDGDALTTLREAQSALDRAARHGVIHPNAAARRKSRLATRLKAAGIAAA